MQIVLWVYGVINQLSNPYGTSYNSPVTITYKSLQLKLVLLQKKIKLKTTFVLYFTARYS